MNVFEAIDLTELDENESQLSEMLRNAALALSVAADGRLIVADTDSGGLYWCRANALYEMIDVSNAAVAVYRLKGLPQGADRALIEGHFAALMDSLKKLAHSAMLELERLGSSGAALVFTKQGEAKIYELGQMCLDKEQHLEALRDEIRVREKQLAHLKSLGGNQAQPGKEAPGANGEMLP